MPTLEHEGFLDLLKISCAGLLAIPGDTRLGFIHRVVRAFDGLPVVSPEAIVQLRDDEEAVAAVVDAEGTLQVRLGELSRCVHVTNNDRREELCQVL